eukprot:5405015-Alexandrium_andersonii.AAC.1
MVPPRGPSWLEADRMHFDLVTYRVQSNMSNPCSAQPPPQKRHRHAPALFGTCNMQPAVTPLQGLRGQLATQAQGRNAEGE